MESAPNTGFNAEPSEPNKASGSKESAKKFTPWSPDTPPVRRFESSRGNTSLPEHEKRLPFRPLGERSAEDAPAPPERDLSTMLRREHAQPPLRAAEDLGSAATREEQEHLDNFLRANEQEASEPAKAKDASKDGEGKAAIAAEKPKEPVSEAHDSFQDFISAHKELADLSEEVLASTAVAKPAAETVPLESSGGDDHPEVVPDMTTPHSFEDFVRNHAELADLSAETPAAAANAEGSPTDDAFRELVTREGAPDPGVTAWNEGEPGAPPTDAGGNMPPRPPIPPTAEGGDYHTPEPGPFGEQTPLNPALARNPWAPAGELALPATLAGLTALEAQRDLDNLRNKSRDAGLAAAVGILGLGLILEHFGAKRRHKRNQRQIKAQGKELKQTNQTLEDERLAHQQTRQELKRLARAHTATTEQLRQVQTHDVPELTKAAEVGAIGTLAAAEIANRAARKTEEHQQEAAALAAAGTPEAAALAAQGGEQALVGTRSKLPEAVAATVYANTIRQEMRHERMQDTVVDAGSSTTAAVRARQDDQQAGSAMLPPVVAAGSVSQAPVSAAEKQAQQKQSSLLASRWTWAIVGLIIVAAAAALFA